MCEFTNATTTQCYDPRRKTWSRPLLERLAIPTHIFPEIVQPGTVLGDLRGYLAEEAGIAKLSVIAPACHDTGSAVAAVPAQAAPGSGDFLWISSGTWSIMGVEVKEPVINAQSLEYTMTNEGGVNGTYRLSKNIMGLWPVQECRRTWAHQGQQYTYDELTRMAAEAEPLRSVIDPDHDDFLNLATCQPASAPIARELASPSQKLPDRLCALHWKALRSNIAGSSSAWTACSINTWNQSTLWVAGTQNKLLSQLTADATQRQVVTGPVEATAIGNLLVQAVALGQIGSLEEAREVVRRSFDVLTFDPTRSTCSAWDAAYAKLLKLMEA